MNLSPNFTVEEFQKSQTALRKGIPNVMGPAEIAAAKLLCEKVLEPLRAHYGRPIVLSSGYRSPALNKAIGGAVTSQHAKGQAADFEIPGLDNYSVAKWMEAHLNYDQLILEMHTPGQPNSGWIHVSYRVPYRNQELTFDGKRYLEGLRA
ncbi:DUF882 domain-containing protein [Sphingobium phenoxybenzoativorans]|uniref:DUF882 domain-containing protein n=1 Tax=Sphingobium phenoxybenzoativorans TaxID=1592790 RepID=A0A975Q3U8_9SPHN|nr:D-Ala-D-Ala carboxypeptidase family metallohydrolase [Sphingobium phenoxybenzoativorans]QUT07902.1 DUF882 domain-containing protein [Sphingobium phenoxybenzoativorans]